MHYLTVHNHCRFLLCLTSSQKLVRLRPFSGERLPRIGYQERNYTFDIPAQASIHLHPFHMIDFIFSLGYLGLFIISFLAASLIPLSSELFVLGMPVLGYNIWLVAVVATLGNFFGALLNYYVGKKGSDLCLAAT